MTDEEVAAARGLMANLISEYPPNEIIHRYISRSYTGAQMAEEIKNGTDIGRQYASDVLRIARDFLARQAKKHETKTNKLNELGTVLWDRTNLDWYITANESLTEPLVPTANLYPEGYPSNRYASHGDTIYQAIDACVDKAYREWVLGEKIESEMPWTNSSDSIEILLEKGLDGADILWEDPRYKKDEHQ